MFCAFCLGLSPSHQVPVARPPESGPKLKGSLVLDTEWSSNIKFSIFPAHLKIEMLDSSKSFRLRHHSQTFDFAKDGKEQGKG